jgi:hypothetical protein
MQATGSYWKPIWYVLEELEDVELLLVNARHLKQVPGRKTDVKDAVWLCELLEVGLLRSSLVPGPVIRQLRDLTRYRKRLVQTRTSETQRVDKTLEDAVIKLGPVASSRLTKSGRAMIEALIAGERDPRILAELAQGRMRGPRTIIHVSARSSCLRRLSNADRDRGADVLVAGHHVADAVAGRLEPIGDLHDIRTGTADAQASHSGCWSAGRRGGHRSAPRDPRSARRCTRRLRGRGRPVRGRSVGRGGCVRRRGWR